ncbi:MAG: helix-turn-helix domain-containing protein [Pseudomonadota bacterium]
MKLQKEPIDNHQARSEATQQALMLAAEKLIAAKGIENVSIRDILNEAGQKNQSALQYHFKNRSGLIAALQAWRNTEVEAKRAELIQQVLAQTNTPALRDICRLMVLPIFELAQAKPYFRRYVKAFGHEIALADEPAITLANKHGGQSGQQIGLLLRKTLNQLGDAAFQDRIDSTLRFVSASMAHHARQKNAFRGEHAELFINRLIDALVGLLGAAESEETKAAAQSINRLDKSAHKR